MNLEKIKLIEFQKKTFVIVNLIAISLFIYFSIGNLLNRNLTQAILNYPQLRIIIREIEKPKPLSITQNELDLAIKKAEIKIKYFPTSIYEFVNLGDLITYSSIQNKNIALINRSEELYCQAFNLLPIPSFYNNLLNINKLTGKDFKEMCKSDKNISEKLIKYDIFGLVPSNFY